MRWSYCEPVAWPLTAGGGDSSAAPSWSAVCAAVEQGLGALRGCRLQPRGQISLIAQEEGFLGDDISRAHDRGRSSAGAGAGAVPSGTKEAADFLAPGGGFGSKPCSPLTSSSTYSYS